MYHHLIIYIYYSILYSICEFIIDHMNIPSIKKMWIFEEKFTSLDGPSTIHRVGMPPPISTLENYKVWPELSHTLGETMTCWGPSCRQWKRTWNWSQDVLKVTPCDVLGVGGIYTARYFLDPFFFRRGGNQSWVMRYSYFMSVGHALQGWPCLEVNYHFQLEL